MGAEAPVREVLVATDFSEPGVSRVLLGSVADRVLRTAACPVLTIPSRALEERPERR
jgi:hypothetical protein